MPPHKTEPKKWKPPKGPKPVQHKNKNTIGLGRNIQNVRAKENRVVYLPDGELRFTTDKHEANWVKLRSVTQENALDEFLNTAELADTDFTAEKGSSVKIIQINNRSVDNKDGLNPYLLTKEEEEAKFNIQKQFQNELTVPRRPKWNESMSKFQLERLENDAFLEWRRQLAHLQENNDLLLTPFERNIMVWKQLWRVIERSDLVVQIVDARNPLLFRSIDLEKYVKELNPLKRNLLLVNKADLLTFEQRLEWVRYFQKHNIRYTFFSAAKANEILELEKEQEELDALNNRYNEYDDEDDEDDDDDEEEEEEEEDDEEEEELDESDYDDELSEELTDDEEVDEVAEAKKEEQEEEDEEQKEQLIESTEISEEDEEELKQLTRIITVQELEELLLGEAPEPLTEAPPGQPQRVQIGLVGYPNVGKSSTINALVGSKKVSVSSTPGKTKHFQTILLSDRVILCDCPGLVFPNFAFTNAELVCNGVLPIDQLREYTGPAQLVAQRIPKYFIEAVYGIAIPTRSAEEGGKGYPTSEELLTAYARSRGYMTQGFGSADEARAARYILKDYVNGKLLYIEPPLNEDGSRASLEEAIRFNKGSYTVDHLPQSRRDQLISAAADKGITDLDLARDLSRLTFSSHLGNAEGGNAKTINYYGGKQAALNSTSAELDQEFFKMNNVKGTFSSPFHKSQVASGSSKKHNKKNKKQLKTNGSIASKLF
ncbi:hypothetical protein B5S28_g2827 [[Candida] boidinii]|nr:hypothetical protein B5S28_g2827 [[Candida] boidinii]OWB74076.1 hypothetical protein B5S31_g3852 [[Candida] boidinii]